MTLVEIILSIDKNTLMKYYQATTFHELFKIAFI